MKKDSRKIVKNTCDYMKLADISWIALTLNATISWTKVQKGLSGSALWERERAESGHNDRHKADPNSA